MNRITRQLYRQQIWSCRRRKIPHRQLLQSMMRMMNLVKYLSHRKNLPNLQKYVINPYVIAMS